MAAAPAARGGGAGSGASGGPGAGLGSGPASAPVPGPSASPGADPYADLPETVRGAVRAHCEAGADLWAQEKAEDAVYEWEQAAFLLPEPKEEWEVSFYVFSHIGEAYWRQRDWEAADEFFRWAYSSPGGSSEPSVLLRLGQACQELGNKEEAADYLAQAYYAGGAEVFEGEDPKYLTSIRDYIDEAGDA